MPKVAPTTSGSTTPLLPPGPYSHISAISQQSRFHTETIDKLDEIDLKAVTLNVGDRELIIDSNLKLKPGTRYALMGRNGTGKSTLLQAIDQKIIPGIGKSIRILLLSQVTATEPSSSTSKSKKSASETSASKTDAPTKVTTSKRLGKAPESASKKESEGRFEGKNKLRVLDWVIEGDKTRGIALEEYTTLSKLIDNASPQNIHLQLLRHRLSRARLALIDAQELARRRSGARGWDARSEEIKAEDLVRISERALTEAEASNCAGIDEKAVMDEALAVLTELQMTLDGLESSKTTSAAGKILFGLGFSQDMMEGPYGALSGGWRSRCQLAVALLIQSDILMLDEPTNYLDLEAILWLERYLIDQTRTVVITSHDQDFLENVVEETIVIRNQKLKYFDGTPGQMEIQEKKERKMKIKQSERLDKKKEHIEKSIKQGMASAKKTGDDNRMRMVKSRQKKLDERFGLETNAKGGRFKLNRDMAGYFLTNRAGVEMEDQESFIKIKIADPEPLRTVGNLLHFDKVSFKWPKAKKAHFEDVTFTLAQGGRISLIGQNGQGKSTLVKLIQGEIQPSTGTIIRHPLMKIGYFSQHSVEALSTPGPDITQETTALSYFLDYFEKQGNKVEEKHARACLGQFGLPGKLASDIPLLVLSGGQKVRLAFALLVYRPPTLLVLDEITTHLDLATIQALARSLKSFSGGIVLVTHDRWFNRIVIEGVSFREASQAYQDGELSEDDISSESSEDELSLKKGETWRVDSGKVKLMTKGMTQYVTFVEKRLAKREKEAEDLANKG